MERLTFFFYKIENKIYKTIHNKTEKDARKVMTRDKPEGTEGPEELTGTGICKSAW